MRPARINKIKIASYTRPLIATALVAGGLFQAAAPVMADIAITGPLANTSISNTATASYEDPNDPTGTPINTISNTVTIVVAKVAGIVVQSKGFTQETSPGVVNPTPQFAPGETIYSNFEVVNTGNDGVKFKVPKNADFTGNATFTKVQYLNGSTWTDANDTTPSQTIEAGKVLKVRIVLQIKADALANDPIVTTLGHTSTAPLGKDNVARGINGEDTDNDRDIYTIDVTTTDPLVQILGVAANGTREASAQQQIAVKAQKQAFATVNLTHDPAVSQTAANTDKVNYNLSVTVPSLAPAGSGKTATDLAPTPIKLATVASATTGTDVNRVLLSFPLPTGATLDSITPPTTAPVLPDGSNGVWTPVYSTTAGVWSTIKPTAGQPTSVGFILEAAPTTTAAPTVDGPSLPMNGGTPYSGFKVAIITPALGTYPTTATIAGTTPGADGKADPTKPVVGTGGDTITTTRTVATVIYNGPSQKPQAKGPGGDNNTDFTNKSMAIPVGSTRDSAGVLNTLPGTSVIFTNTVENSTINAADVYLLPTPPTVKLPNNTKVTISNIDGTDTRVYTYSDTGAGSFTVVTADASKPPLKLAIAGKSSTSYSTTVKLADGGTVDQLKGFAVPITAFTGAPTSDVTNGLSAVPVSATSQNTTIDRVYTGYIDLLKEVRALSSVSLQNSSDASIPYESVNAKTRVKAVPGEFIQYRIKANNISEAVDLTATDSKVLDAANVKIVENGTTGGNTWGGNTTHAADSAVTMIGTTPTGGVTFSPTGKINADPDITAYEANLAPGKVGPGQTGSFSFVRQVKTPTP